MATKALAVLVLSRSMQSLYKTSFMTNRAMLDLGQGYGPRIVVNLKISKHLKKTEAHEVYASHVSGRETPIRNTRHCQQYQSREEATSIHMKGIGMSREWHKYTGPTTAT